MKKFLIVLLVIACIAGGIYFAVTQRKADEATEPAPQTTQVATVATQAPTAKATTASTKTAATATPTAKATTAATKTAATATPKPVVTATATPEPTAEPTPELVTEPKLLCKDGNGYEYWQLPDGTVLKLEPQESQVEATPEPTPEPTPTPEPAISYPYFFVKNGENMVIPMEGAPEMKAVDYLTMLYGTQSGSSTQTQSTATPTPTATPKATATPKPVVTPTPAPTAKPANNKLGIMQRETLKCTEGNYVYVNYTLPKTRDYKASLGTNINDLYGRDMFDVLAPEFVKFAGNFAMQFDGTGTPEERFQQAINSAVGGEGRLILVEYSSAQSAQMSKLLGQVTDYEKVTKTMVLWLVEYTAINPNNSSERVFLVQ